MAKNPVKGKVYICTEISSVGLAYNPLMNVFSTDVFELEKAVAVLRGMGVKESDFMNDPYPDARPDIYRKFFKYDIERIKEVLGEDLEASNMLVCEFAFPEESK